MTDGNELTFEEARQELERIVGELESGKADLERAVELWERGEELYRQCLSRLDAAEAKIEQLSVEPGGAADASDAP